MKNNEWYTPAKYIEAARSVMGGIDLDPASCEMANRTVRAARYYTKEDNGLMQPWHGRVWLNPPFGRTNQGMHPTFSFQTAFIQKLTETHLSGNVEQAVLLLLGNSCYQKWFAPPWDYPLCFHNGKIIFTRENMREDSFGFGTCFVYLGPNEAAFITTFSQFGRIVRAIDTPAPKPVARELWAEVEAI